MFPLSAALRRFIKQGRLKVTNYDGKTFEFGDPTLPLDAAVSLRDPDTAWRLVTNPELNVGQEYTDGALVIEKGTLLNFLRLLLLNSARLNSTTIGQIYHRTDNLLRLPSVFNPMRRSRRNVKHHYDLSDELFSLFLDRDRQYSCAYFRSETDDIETAQLAKKQHIAAKLAIRPNQHILDIGSGWGGLALYLAQHYPVRVTGVTLSDEQFRVSNARAAQLGLSDRVTFKLQDYRQESGVYDRIVSVGMFEHVGRPHFSKFFRKVYSLLTPDGVALIHCIGFQTPPAPINSWLRQYIFPGAYLPSLSQLTPIFERQNIWLADMESLRLHYARTLAAWYARFQENRDRVARLYDERFCRMWEFYLQSCEAGFRWGWLTVFQLQLAKDIAALPVTRDYMLREEERLRAIDSGVLEAPAHPVWETPPATRDPRDNQPGPTH
ncbi:MAG TPA: cyclopropane-fatty-acyl-phospholipid synthase family protein [Hyphomicrobiales bacterium]|jgi:cyclopropane-fatty-acyl-phospholipid synthase